MTSSSNWRDLIHCLTSGLNLTTFLLLFPIVLVSPGNAQTLKAVKERGVLNCGVSQGLLGFSNADDKNNWSGFDVDFCRAVAAAIFDDPSKVAFVPLDAPARFTALQSNKIDVLSRNRARALAVARALTSIRPPPTCGSRPCLIAFSTSGCSSSGGTGRPASSAGSSSAPRAGRPCAPASASR